MSEVWVAIVLAGLGTFAMRASFVAAAHRLREVPPWLARILRQIPAAALAAIVLPDSGRLHEEEAAYANRKGYSKHRPALPLYTEADAERAVRSLRPITFDTKTQIAHGITMRLAPAGHILGSAVVSLNIESTSRDPIDLTFSGDLGRPDHPLIVAEERLVVVEQRAGKCVGVGESHRVAGDSDRYVDAAVLTSGGACPASARVAFRLTRHLARLRHRVAC